MNALRPKSFWERNSTWLTLLLIAGLLFTYLQLFSAPVEAVKPPNMPSYLTFGSGPVNGTYFPVVRALASHLSSAPERIGGHRIRIRCDTGSVSTTREVISGRLDFGMAQSAVLYDAANGLRDWAPYGRMMNLRSVCTLATKELTIVARVDSGIRSTADLGGKRVNIGEPGSGTNSNARQLLDFLAKNGNKAPEGILELSNDAALAAFRESRLDAIITNLTHPSRYLQDVFRCGVPAQMVRFDEIDDFVKNYPYYAISTLPAQMYLEAKQPRALRVISTPTILFTTDGTPASLVKTLMTEIIVNLQEIKAGNPELQSLELDNLLADKIVATHPGALDAFYEAGILHARSDPKRNTLMAVSFRRNDPLAEKMSAGLCQEVNSLRIPDLRLVLLVADNEQETIYRVISGIAHFGFANSAELYNAAEGAGVWQPMGALRGLASLARVYDVALFRVAPVAPAPADGNPRPYYIPGTPDASQFAAIQKVWAALNPSGPELEARPQAEAAAAYAAGQAGLLLTAELHGDNPAADLQAWHQNWEQLRGAYHLPPLRLEGVAVTPEIAAKYPWLDELTIPFGGQTLRTASIPVMLFSSIQASEKRMRAALQAISSQAVQGSNEEALARRFAYMASRSPLPFHPALTSALEELKLKHPALRAIHPVVLAVPQTHELTISAPSSNSGQFMAAGMVSDIVSRPRSLLVGCTMAAGEKEALDDIRSGRADLAIVSAEAMVNENPKLTTLRVLGSLYTVPLAFYADMTGINKSPLTMGDFIGKRISAPDPAFPGRIRGLGISVLSPEAFASGLNNRTLINTEETDLSAAISMYNKGTISGFFMSGLQPMPQIMSDVSTARQGRFVPITEGYRQVIEKGDFVNTVIPRRLQAYYAQAGAKIEDVPSIGVPVMLVGTTRISGEIAGQVLKSLAENIKQIRETHPAFADFEAGEFLKGVAVAPLHPGALRYYQQQGFLVAPGTRDIVQVLNLGTGSPKGGFFPVGVFLERLINSKTNDRNAEFQITLEISDGSHQNCLAVNDRAYDFGISQADLASLAFHGKMQWASKDLSALRAVCNLQDVPLFCFVRSDLKVKHFRELKGRSINIGAESSGTWVLAQRVLGLLSEAERSQLRLEQNDDSVALDKLYAGGLDALFLSMGSSEVMNRLLAPGSAFRPLSFYTPELAATVLGTSERIVTLTPGTFPGLREELTTISTPAILLANKDVNPEIVRDILRIIIRERASFPQLPAQLRSLRNEDLGRNLALPLHDGAKAALQEAGLLPADAQPEKAAP